MLLGCFWTAFRWNFGMYLDFLQVKFHASQAICVPVCNCLLHAAHASSSCCFPSAQSMIRISRPSPPSPSPIPAWRWHIYGALCSNVAITHCSWLPLDWMQQPSPPSERWGSLISKYSLWKQELMNRNQGGINGHLKSTLFMPPSSPLSSPLFLLANQLGSVLCGFLEILQSGPADSGTKLKVGM